MMNLIQSAKSTIRMPVIVGLLLLPVGIALRCILAAGTDFAVGDAFIGFRFAEQFAQGHGLVFNTGELVGGNTSPLFSILMGMGALSGIAIPLVSRMIGIGFDIGVFFVAWRITAGFRSPWLRVAIPGMLFLHPMLLPYSICGLETTVYVFFIFLLAWFTIESKVTPYCLAALAVLFARPDGVVAIAVTMGFWLWIAYQRVLATVSRDDRDVVTPLVIAFKQVLIPLVAVMVIGASYGAMNYFLYGSPIPPTVALKAFYGQSTIVENVTFITARFFFKHSSLFVAYGVVLVWGAWLARKFRPAVLFCALSVAYLLFLMLAPALRTWYVVPFIYLSFTGILLSIGAILNEHESPLVVPSVATSLGVYVLVAGVAFRSVYHECKVWRSRIAVQVEAGGNWIRQNTPPDATIFVTALETGWFAKRHTLDFPGLVSPQVFKLLKEHRNLDFLQMADYFKVDYAFYMSDPVEEIKVPPNYEYVKSFGAEYGDEHMGIEKTRYSLFKRVKKD